MCLPPPLSAGVCVNNPAGGGSRGDDRVRASKTEGSPPHAELGMGAVLSRATIGPRFGIQLSATSVWTSQGQSAMWETGGATAKCNRGEWPRLIIRDDWTVVCLAGMFTNGSTGMFGNVHTPVASMLLPVLPSSSRFPFSVVRHLMLYPPAHTKTPAPARLRAARGRSSSMTDQTQRQPSGGARFMTAR